MMLTWDYEAKETVGKREIQYLPLCCRIHDSVDKVPGKQIGIIKHVL